MKNQHDDNGYLIIYSIIITAVLMGIGLALLSVAGTKYSFSKNGIDRQNIANIAKGCAGATVTRMNESIAPVELTDQVVFDRIAAQGGKATCSTTVSPDKKNIEVNAKLERSVGDPKPMMYQAKATLGAEEVVAPYQKSGMLVGSGGLVLPLYGALQAPQLNVAGWMRVGARNWSTVGTSSTPISTINIGNVACGTNANWPQPCSTPPVQKWYTGASEGYVYGNVCATGQVDGSFMSSPGLTANCTAPKIKMPVFDKQSFVAKMKQTMSGQSIVESCVVPRSPSYLGNRGIEYHVPADTRITGDLNLNAVPSFNTGACRILFDGDVYLEGNVIRPTQDVQAGVSNTVTSDITLVVNGFVQMSGAKFVPNGTGKIAHLISFYSSDSSCSTRTDVPSKIQASCLTPAQAKSSATIGETSGSTPYAALDLKDFRTTVDLSGMTFYAYYAGVDLGCNNVTIVALAAQGVGSNCSIGYVLGNTTITGNAPTFGVMEPVVRYRLLDYRQVYG